jgi:WhiB family transcriptional regulator, redox-sensing transcriptional regulator
MHASSRSDLAAPPVGRDDPAVVPLAPDSPHDPPDRPDRAPAASVDRDEVTLEIDESLAARAPVARCADGNGTMTGLFFSDHVVDIARAKAMCALCPLRLDCLAGALEREEPWGVWGGELLSGGRIVENKRPCGRPPKHPRPDVVYDEMGPVGFELTA